MKKMKAFVLQMHKITLLLALANQIQHTQSFLSNNLSNQKTFTAAFAGFGSNSSTQKNKGKKSKKKRRGLINDDDFKPASPTIQKEPEVQLDRFGLPIRTAENFFPPLPPDAKILGYKSQEGQSTSTLDDVKRAMEKHIQLNYDIFDESAVEKKNDASSSASVLASDNTSTSTSARKPWKVKLLHKSPPVLEIQNFFTPQECAEYRSISEEESKPDSDSGSGSPLRVNSATFSSLAQSKRTSTTWFCHFSQVPTLLAKAKRLLNNLPLKQMEEAQIVRYRTGEEFSWHYDEIPSAQLDNGGQRIATLLVYLNSNSKGGGTIFRDLKDSTTGADLTMRPKEGSALLFFPAFANGTPDDRTLHKGEVAVEEKMIAQMWIHQKDYKPVIPKGNTHEAAMEAIQAKEMELGYRYL